MNDDDEGKAFCAWRDAVYSLARLGRKKAKAESIFHAAKTAYEEKSKEVFKARKAYEDALWAAAEAEAKEER